MRGAFVDSNGVRWDTNDAENMGWLSKKSKWLGEVRSRFFVLKGSKLFFATSEEEAPHGMIDLVDCVSVKPHGDQSTIEISLKDETYVLMAGSINARDKWVKCIDEAIVRQGAMYFDD
jgi:hypothetical protein